MSIVWVVPSMRHKWTFVFFKKALFGLTLNDFSLKSWKTWKWPPEIATLSKTSRELVATPLTKRPLVTVLSKTAWLLSQEQGSSVVTVKDYCSTEAPSSKCLVTFLVLSRPWLKFGNLIENVYERAFSDYIRATFWSVWSRLKVIFGAFSSVGFGKPNVPLFIRRRALKPVIKYIFTI